jgi:uncharacterized protein YpmB
MLADSDTDKRKIIVFIIIVILCVIVLLIIGSLTYEYDKILSPSATGDKNWDGN